MNFIGDTDGIYHLVDRVHHIEPLEDELCLVTTEDGRRVNVSANALTVVHLLEGTVVQYLPAAPGTYKLITVRDANDAIERLEKVSVVAWAVAGHGGLMPITVKYGLGCQHCVILQPSGLVETLDEQWSSLADYEAALRETDSQAAELEAAE